MRLLAWVVCLLVAASFALTSSAFAQGKGKGGFGRPSFGGGGPSFGARKGRGPSFGEGGPSFGQGRGPLFGEGGPAAGKRGGPLGERGWEGMERGPQGHATRGQAARGEGARGGEGDFDRPDFGERGKGRRPQGDDLEPEGERPDFERPGGNRGMPEHAKQRQMEIEARNRDRRLAQADHLRQIAERNGDAELAAAADRMEAFAYDHFARRLAHWESFSGNAPPTNPGGMGRKGLDLP
jgi:hypothetical protein